MSWIQGKVLFLLISSTQPLTTLHVQDGYHGQMDLLRGTHNHGLSCNISLFVSLEQFEVFRLAEGVVSPSPRLGFWKMWIKRSKIGGKWDK